MALSESTESHYQVINAAGKTIGIVPTYREVEALKPGPGSSIKWLERGDTYNDVDGQPTSHGFGGDGLHA